MVDDIRLQRLFLKRYFLCARFGQYNLRRTCRLAGVLWCAVVPMVSRIGRLALYGAGEKRHWEHGNCSSQTKVCLKHVPTVLLVSKCASSLTWFALLR